MAIERVFLDWSAPCLPQAAEWLIAKAGDARCIDLRGYHLILPGGRALRRLTELLVERADQDGKSILLPDFGTTGHLPELLYESTQRPADSLERTMAWFQALRDSDPALLEVCITRPPARENTHAWFLIAQRIDRLHAEVGAGGYDFAAVAAHCSSSTSLFVDDRWEALAAVEKRFQILLEDLDRSDVHSERRKAASEGRCHFEGSLVLIGMAELALLPRKMLLEATGEIISLVHAPKNSAKFFDELGCVLPQSWTDRPIGLPESALAFARDPAAQASLAVSMLAGLHASYPAEEITIGTCARDAKPFLLEALSEHSIPARDASGFAIENSPPVVFLRLLAEYLGSKSFHAFTTLVRQPHVQAALLNSKELRPFNPARKSLLEALDRYHHMHLQSEVADSMPNVDSSGRVPALAIRALHELLGALMGTPRPLSEWAPEITRALIAVFGSRPLNSYQREDALIIRTCESLHEQLAQMHELRPAKHTTLPACEALKVVLSQLTGQFIESGGTEEAIELLGWLELHLDDAQALIVTGLNEGYVPECINADPFLPNALRSSLGLLDNNGRYARDAYMLSAIAQGRRFLKLVATRLDAQGSPLRPSRLLLAERGEVAARRIQLFFESTRQKQPQLFGDAGTAGAAQPPRPIPLDTPPDSMKVTSFKDYLTCPYRYYLRHILKLQSLDDSALELDAAAAGTLLHSVLTAFGQSDAKLETSAEVIEEFLLDALARQFHTYFGTKPLPTLFVQRLQAQERLKAFARWQSAWVQQGWEIRETEYAIKSAGAALTLGDDNRMELLGRIDRIDFHPVTKEWFIFDYKTGERGDSPEKTHRRRKRWVDLQLPLYRYLAERSGYKGSIRAGFVLLPADLKKCREEEATWTDGEYHQAIDEAIRIAELVRAQVFWPPARLPSSAYDDYRLIVGHEFGSTTEEDAA